MKSATLKITQAQKNMLDEIKSLKNLPKTTETRDQIDQIRERFNSPLSSRGSATGPGPWGITIQYRSFEGKFDDGRKAVALYSKYEDEIYWTGDYLFTWMTEVEARTYFGYPDPAEITVEINGCLFRQAFFIADDEGIDFPSFESIRQDLGLVGAKSYFDSFYYPFFGTDLIDILRGQKIYLVDRDVIPNVLKGTVTFPESTISESTISELSSIWFYIIIVILILIILIRRK